MPFAHGLNLVGLPSIDAWEELLALARSSGSFLSVDPAACPAHFSVFACYHTAMRKLPARRPAEELGSFARFERFVEEAGGAHPQAYNESEFNSAASRVA